jgi:hypothetical protein
VKALRFPPHAFVHTPTFSDEQVAFDPAAGVFIIAAERERPKDPPRRPVHLVQWQPAKAGKVLQRLAVVLGLERRR